MDIKISLDIIEKWLTGWSSSRNLFLPAKYKSGLKVEVGYENQKIRYVFPEVDNDFIELLKSIDDSWIFLKVCTSSEEIIDIIPKKWTIEPQRFMMSCFNLMEYFKYQFKQ